MDTQTTPIAARTRRTKFSKAQLEELVARGLAQAEIAEALGTYRTYVCRLLKRYGIPYVARPGSPHNPVKLYEVLHHKRVVEKKTVSQIAAETGMTMSQTYYRLRRLRLTGPDAAPGDLHSALLDVRGRLETMARRLDESPDPAALTALRADLHYAVVGLTRLAERAQRAA